MTNKSLPLNSGTAFPYGMDYQMRQAEKYRNRNRNHWKDRIELSQYLFNHFSYPRIIDKKKEDISIVDVGCSVGTFAIEYAKLGFRTFGIDFDQSALDLAMQLSAEENVHPYFICGDVSDWDSLVETTKIDVAFCFDIFEHLHDDEIGSLLNGIKKHLSQFGSIIFHTFPTEYTYIFFHKSIIRYIPQILKRVDRKLFNKLILAYASFLDIGYILIKGKRYKTLIKNLSHCNPLTADRLYDIFTRSGFDLQYLQSSNLYTEFIDNATNIIQKRLNHQPISHRNIYGVATLK